MKRDNYYILSTCTEPDDNDLESNLYLDSYTLYRDCKIEKIVSKIISLQQLI